MSEPVCKDMGAAKSKDFLTGKQCSKAQPRPLSEALEQFATKSCARPHCQTEKNRKWKSPHERGFTLETGFFRPIVDARPHSLGLSS